MSRNNPVTTATVTPATAAIDAALVASTPVAMAPTLTLSTGRTGRPTIGTDAVLEAARTMAREHLRSLPRPILATAPRTASKRIRDAYAQENAVLLAAFDLLKSAAIR